MTHEEVAVVEVWQRLFAAFPDGKYASEVPIFVQIGSLKAKPA